MIRKKVKILIVDDRPENLLALKAILDRPDYELISANSGEEALKWVLTEDFAVILLDIQMPGLDGFETASLIHKRERSRKIPIIFITAIHRDIEQVIHGYSLGAIDYIFKPVNPETLRYKIDGFVRLYIYREQLENKIQEKIEELSCVNKKLLNEVKQRKISEAALKKSEYRFKKLFLDSIMGISLMDSKGRIFESNPALHSILGYSAEELKGHTYSEFLYSTKDQEINIKIQRLVMGESSQYQIEKKFKSKTGQVIWGKLYLSLVRDHNGKIMYVIGMLNDITESKKNQNKASLLASIVESTKDGIISVSLEGIIQSWNHGAKEIFGYEPDEIIGCHISKIVPPDKLDESENVLRAVKKGCSCKRYETVRINKEGKRINVAMTVSPLKNQGGLIVGFSGIVRDITKYKILQNELNRLDRLNLIGQMSASIAHEIRNPMTTIRGFLQIMREKAELFEYKKYFDLMTGELDRVNGIITEYLSLARNKPRELKKGNIKKIIETMSPLISADARNSNKDVFFKLQEVPDFPLDEKEIRQLLLNLVRNGFEAMEAGKALTISTYTERNAVVLSVRDEGKGMDQAVIEKLGTPFFTTKEVGTGLGLTLCYSIASRHNASISVDSGNKGTCFKVKFSLN